jgi:imidazolonepropionase-like amidohydrolase
MTKRIKAIFLAGCLLSLFAQPLLSEIRVLKGFTLIDGTGRPPVANSAMIIDNGRITWVGPVANLKMPASAQAVDLTGKFVMPGIINLHGHLGNVVGLEQAARLYTRESVEHDLKTYASYGVTTMLSLGLDRDFIFDIRAKQRQGRPTSARVYTAGLGLVYKGGFGGGITLPGVPTPILADAKDAEPAVAQEARKNVDIIKFWTDDNYGTAKRMPNDIAKAIIDSAHKHGLRAIAHVFYLEDAKHLADDGIDALAHSVRDKPVDAELINSMKRHGTWLAAPTLSREAALFAYTTSPSFLSDPFFTRSVSPDVLKTLASPEFHKKAQADPNISQYPKTLSRGESNLKALADAGVKYGMGTDTGVPGRFHGYFEHLELETMVHAGLTPMQVIVAATKSGAEFLQAKDLGTLEPSKWADLIVLTKNPVQDIRNTRTIETVYIAGNPVFSINETSHGENKVKGK